MDDFQYFSQALELCIAGPEAVEAFFRAEMLFEKDKNIRGQFFQVIMQKGFHASDALLSAWPLFARDAARYAVFLDIAHSMNAMAVRMLAKAAPIYKDDPQNVIVTRIAGIMKKHGMDVCSTLMQAKKWTESNQKKGELFQVWLDLVEKSGNKAGQALLRASACFGNNIERQQKFAALINYKGIEASDAIVGARSYFRGNEKLVNEFLQAAYVHGPLGVEAMKKIAPLEGNKEVFEVLVKAMLVKYAEFCRLILMTDSAFLEQMASVMQGYIETRAAILADHKMMDNLDAGWEIADSIEPPIKNGHNPAKKK